MNFNPQNILVVNFGQLGDVVLSLPALRIIRERFPDAKITALVGKASAEIIEITGLVDEKIAVDRVRLRDSPKIWSIKEILKLVKDIRRRKFDFIIDLHSLYETNLLGFLSGAKHRLFANRENRSLDFLARFEPKPPLEDKNKHLTEYYLRVLSPLGIENIQRFVEPRPPRSDIETVENLLRDLSLITPLENENGKRFVRIHPPKKDIETIENLLRERHCEGKKLVGLFPGAGHPGRRWSLENFAQLAKILTRQENLQTIVFLGPEEENMRAEIEEKFPPETIVFDRLTLAQFAAALSKIQVLVSNDTGAVHLGAVVGAFVVILSQQHAPITYLPLTEKLCVIKSGTLNQIGVEEVLRATRNFLANDSFTANEKS